MEFISQTIDRHILAYQPNISFTTGTAVSSQNDTLLRIRGEPAWLAQIGASNIIDPPYCIILNDPLDCQVVTRPTMDQTQVEIWAYDYSCGSELGHWTTAIGNEISQQYQVGGFQFITHLPWGLPLFLTLYTNPDRPAVLRYAGHVFGWGATTSWCWNGGFTFSKPWEYRLACNIPYRCVI